MGYFSLFMRRHVGACAAIVLAAGCAAPQAQTVPAAVAPQHLSIAVQPAVDCPVVGKTYTRSDGHGRASMKFQEAWTKAGPYESLLRTELVYDNWPANRPFVYRKLVLNTCGPESGKAPVGEVSESGGNSEGKCQDGLCTWTIRFDVVYRPPLKLPNGKRWKFDLVRYAPDKPTKGFDPIPVYRVIVTR